ncbi:hypothetical protein QBC35DRAFT_221461 [Podospora australis]|uniref:Uncharacterized protein n=1 Tax=Podospora australis TaxID=1536484 RepID=A0AAN6WT84_9PEZI|nr:hypothetical protein QBC35DRAFT_221461 [Podospora australis]
MVAIKSLISLLAFGALSVTATPVETEQTVDAKILVARQGPARVYACQNSRWREPCRTFESSPGSCFNVPNDWNDRISSIQNLNRDGFSCVWWEHGGCSGRSYSNQEDAELGDGDGFFNDRISSWRCNVRQRLAAAEATAAA